MAFGKRAKNDEIEGGNSKAMIASPRMETFLDSGCELTGELRFGENVRIDGRVGGQIWGEKAVVIGEGAQIDASIEAESLEIYGSVMGDIVVKRQTTLHKTARVEGEIQTAGIVVEEGARFKGCIVIGPDDESIGYSRSPIAEPAKDSASPAKLNTQPIGSTDA